MRVRIDHTHRAPHGVGEGVASAITVAAGGVVLEQVSINLAIPR
jgi:hypothetical protein